MIRSANFLLSYCNNCCYIFMMKQSVLAGLQSCWHYSRTRHQYIEIFFRFWDHIILLRFKKSKVVFYITFVYHSYTHTLYKRYIAQHTHCYWFHCSLNSLQVLLHIRSPRLFRARRTENLYLSRAVTHVF